MTELRLYDSLRRATQPFRPRVPGIATVYSCGPTVYSRQHLGNMRPYVFADLLTRVLSLQGYEVKHVINITDVGHLSDDADEGEDKLERAAHSTGDSVLEVARVWTELFQRDLRLLGVRGPTWWAKATEHIQDQIEMIRVLEEKGFTYLLADGLYFDTSRDESYGTLSGLRASAAHARVHAASGKRQPADFALWKFSPSVGPRRQLEWASPWGVGFPGWHIECSAMASRYLGREIDIHTGGVDHVAVHHTNEIAQSENALGVRPWVRFWMHGAWLNFDGEKISKSRAHERKPPDLDDLPTWGVTPADFRYYLYTAHYRSPLSLSVASLCAAQAARRRLGALVRAPLRSDPLTVSTLQSDTSTSPASSGSRTRGSAPPLPSEALRKLRRSFFDALYDDLNTPRALSAIWQIVEQPEPLAERVHLIRELAETLGLDLSDPPPQRLDHSEIDGLVEQRERARQERNYPLADALRAELSARGVVIEDTAEGTRWRTSR